MSWAIEAVGTAKQLREHVRRHAHHYWRDMDEREAGAARHAIGHAIDVASDSAPEEQVFLLTGNGSDQPRYSSGLEVNVRRVEPMPPPVPEEPAAGG